MKFRSILKLWVVLSAVIISACGGGGGASSPPPLGDVTAPTVSAFTVPSTGNNLTVSISVFTASDNVGVTGYLVTESAIKPSAGAAGWSATVPTTFTFLAAGNNTAYAWVKDAVGHVSNSLSASVSIDTLPTVSISAAQITKNGLQVSSPVKGTLSIGATASDNIGVTKVEFSIDGILKSTDTTAPYSFTWYTTMIPNGGHTLTATAYDTAGNSTSSDVPLTVNNSMSANILMNISGTTAAGTISLAGAPSPAIVNLVQVIVTSPVGSVFLSPATSPVGGASDEAGALGRNIILLSGTPFSSGNILSVNYGSVPNGVADSDFGVILVEVWDKDGNLIQ